MKKFVPIVAIPRFRGEVRRAGADVGPGNPNDDVEGRNQMNRSQLLFLVTLAFLIMFTPLIIFLILDALKGDFGPP